MIRRIIIFCFIFLSVLSYILAQPISFLPDDPILEGEVVKKRGEEGKRLLDAAWKFYEERKYDKAIEYAVKTLAINPNDYEVNSILGMSYAEKGDFKKAVEYYQKTTNVYPKQIILIAMTTIFSPDDQDYRRNFFKTIEDYKNKIAKDPNNYRAYNNLGYLSFLLRVDPKAEEYYKKSIEIKPDYTQAHYNLAFYYLCDNNNKLALKEYRILERLNKDLARVILRTIKLAENKEK